ncbi:MAG: CBS domain-containing protein [Gaiellaceae bacterium]
MSQATVRETMTPSPTSIPGEASATDAARALLTENVGSLPVVDGDVLTGIVTDRDLVVHVMAKDLDPNKVPVSQICSENPIVAGPEEFLDAALERMAQEQVRRLPVVHEGRLVGILAQADVARTAMPASTGTMVEQISQD